MTPSDNISMLEVTEAYVRRCEEGSLLSPIYLHFRFPKGRRGAEDSEHLKLSGFIAMRNLTPNVGTWRARYDLKGCDDDKALENEGLRIKAIHRRFWHFWYVKGLWSE